MLRYPEKYKTIDSDKSDKDNQINNNNNYNDQVHN